MLKHRSLIAVLLLASAGAAQGWGGAIHAVINEAAAQNVPDEMAGWRAYGPLLAEHGADPDFWKNDDPAEPVRHFIDLEHYGTPPFEIPRDLSTIPATSASGSKREGDAPWVMMDTFARLTEAMREKDWYNAARIAAALGHYVGDTHQPLHCTVNYDGYQTGNAGIHTRWEVEMPRRIGSAAAEINAEPSVYLTNLWGSINGWIMDGWPLCANIFQADKEARWASRNNVESQYYFFQLWEKSQDIFLRRISQAATDLSSVWYTAWVDAGKPEIPPPPKRISSASIHLDRSIGREPAEEDRLGAVWVLVVIAVAGFIIVGSSIRQQRRLTSQRAK
ncbi:MAG: hypothetical protein AB7T27_10445 [Kiritimatiellia bacterium]